VTQKRPQLQGTARELARKQRRGKTNPGAKPREAARSCCWIVRSSIPSRRYAAPPTQPLLLIRFSCSPRNSASSTRIFLPCRSPEFSPSQVTTRFISLFRRRCARGPESSLVGGRRRPSFPPPSTVAELPSGGDRLESTVLLVCWCW
jgi:hypothetical protein